jgi:hypothetical protein
MWEHTICSQQFLALTNAILVDWKKNEAFSKLTTQLNSSVGQCAVQKNLSTADSIPATGQLDFGFFTATPDEV